MILNDGGIAQYGTPEDIIMSPQDDFVESFILNQLEIKKNNIFRLFAAQMQVQAVQSPKQVQANVQAS